MTPKDEESKRIWRRLQREALAMRMSKDEAAQRGGQALLDMFHDLRQSDVDIQIYTDHVLTATSETGSFTEAFGGGVGVNLRSTDFGFTAATVVLAHELGHAHAFWVRGWDIDGIVPRIFGIHDRAGLRPENLMRASRNCAPREKHSARGPTCK